MSEQKKEPKALNLCALLARKGNWLLNLVINMALLLLLLFGVYALMDSWAIFHGAGVSAGLLKYKPELVELDKENPSIKELAKEYPDIRAWLTITDTKIDYPVVQGENNQKYVNYNIEGEFSLSGAIFLDFRNEGDFSDPYSIVYGHHMDMSAMFGGLDSYMEQDYLETHTEGYLFLPEETKKVEIFACISVNAYDEIIFAPAVDDVVADPSLLSYIEEMAITYREVDLSEENQIVALATCSSSGTNLRTVVFGVLR